MCGANPHLQNFKIMMNEQQQYYFSNAINLLALALGMENLQENRQQTKYNDVHAANDKQAEYLLGEINRRFDEQNAILEEQNRMIGILIEELEAYNDSTNDRTGTNQTV